MADAPGTTFFFLLYTLYFLGLLWKPVNLLNFKKKLKKEPGIESVESRKSKVPYRLQVRLRFILCLRLSWLVMTTKLSYCILCKMAMVQVPVHYSCDGGCIVYCRRCFSFVVCCSLFLGCSVGGFFTVSHLSLPPPGCHQHLRNQVTIHPSD